MEKWYDHHPEKVTENKKGKILWNMKLQTDKILEHSRPDIVVFEKKNRTCNIVDVACPFDTRVTEKEREEVDKYQELKYKVQKILSCSEVTVIPAVICALGTISKDINEWLNKINPNIYFGTLQKAFLEQRGLLGTARTLRYALNI